MSTTSIGFPTTNDSVTELNTLGHSLSFSSRAYSHSLQKESEFTWNNDYAQNQFLDSAKNAEKASIPLEIATDTTARQDDNVDTKLIAVSHGENTNIVAEENLIYENMGIANAKPFRFFVGGIPQDIEEEEITAYFMYYGEVKEVRIAKDYFTGFSRGFGFVTMSDEATKAQIFQDSHELRGKRIDVREENNTIPTDINRKIFIGGLDPSWNEACLSSYFTKFGPVETVHIVTDGNGKSRCFAFITFGDENVAQKVIQHGTHNIMERCIEVRKAEPKKSRSNYRNTIAAYQNWYEEYNTAQWYNPSVQGNSLYACADGGWGAPYATQSAAVVPTADSSVASLPPTAGSFYDISNPSDADAASNWYMNSVACAAYANQVYATQQAATAQYMNYYYQGLYGQSHPHSFGLPTLQEAESASLYNGPAELEGTSTACDEKGNSNDTPSPSLEFPDNQKQSVSTTASSESLNQQSSIESDDTQCEEKSKNDFPKTENSSNLLESSSTETLVA
ncbi:Rna recognition motif-containing protein [Cardiosporidium cionae]|uniref:Rna recognition motif-containing protein n=1 Tax=Cardiosporidium cionae TaxID=476202 RepID=A0ABQ7JG67_9APIC|nr:Rna recognition motif-containing protein [Cardiosporidium cionae]|eukprot:KAF8822987.1 Rna recognition motif-containing protein [Cardiosporidium cionae]